MLRNILIRTEINFSQQNLSPILHYCILRDWLMQSLNITQLLYI